MNRLALIFSFILASALSCGRVDSDSKSTAKTTSINGIEVHNLSSTIRITSLYVYKSSSSYKGYDQAFGGTLNPRSKWYNIVAYDNTGSNSFCMVTVEASGYDIDLWGGTPTVSFTGRINICDYKGFSISAHGINGMI